MHCQTRLGQNCRQRPEACLEPEVGYCHLHISLLLMYILRDISVSPFHMFTVRASYLTSIVESSGFQSQYVP